VTPSAQYRVDSFEWEGEHGFVLDLKQDNPRRQGDLGEVTAAAWLARAGFGVWIPFGHSPNIDLMAQQGDDFYRVQVKTSTRFLNGRWEVMLCTRGGNRSWSGEVKKLDPSTFDFLFVVVGDWRSWLIPATALEGRSGICLGGPKYAAFEVTGRSTPAEACALESPRHSRGSARAAKGSRL
jgi:PD-(D/E)XK endonuclease